MPYINNLSFEMKERQYAALQFNITCKMEIKAKASIFSCAMIKALYGMLIIFMIAEKPKMQLAYLR